MVSKSPFTGYKILFSRYKNKNPANPKPEKCS